jgi:hypothetical protein
MMLMLREQASQPISRVKMYLYGHGASEAGAVCVGAEALAPVAVRVGATVPAPLVARARAAPRVHHLSEGAGGQ